MIRLIPAESLPGQQTTKAFSFKKVLECSTMSKPSQGSNSGKLNKEASLWDTAENMLNNDHVIEGEEIPMLPLPMSHQENGAAVPTNEVIQPRSKVEWLEQKLDPKECQLQDANKSFQQMHLQLNATTTWFESQIQEKELAIKEIQNQLFRKQEYKGHSCKSYKLDSCLTNTDAQVVSGSEDGTVLFWDLVDASRVSSVKAHSAVPWCWRSIGCACWREIGLRFADGIGIGKTTSWYACESIS